MKMFKLFFAGLLTVCALPTHAESNDGKLITVKTDTLYVAINTAGGNIEHLDLLKYRDTNDESKPLALFRQQDDRIYVAQSGLLGKGLPTHLAEFSAARNGYQLADDKNTVEVRLTALESNEARVTKAYIFHRSSYLVDVVYEIENRGATSLLPSAYFQLVHDSNIPASSSKRGPAFTGPAIYTKQGKFQKIKFSDIQNNKVKLPTNPDNGWIGILQPDFVSAWLPASKGYREFYTKLDGNVFSAGVLLPLASIEPGQFGHISVTLYAGPAKSSLNNIAPGLGVGGLLP